MITKNRGLEDLNNRRYACITATSAGPQSPGEGQIDAEKKYNRKLARPKSTGQSRSKMPK